MVPQSLYDITLGQIDVFFSAMKHRSFTKAAQELNLTQSAVSKSIARLENTLRFPLFTRHYREIIPTEAAIQLHSGWTRDISSLTRIYEEVYLTQVKSEVRLRLGAAGTTNLSSYFWPLITQFIQRNADIRLEFDSDTINRLIEKLINGQLDLIFIPDFMLYTIENYNLSWQWAAKDYAQIWLPSNHPLIDQPLFLHSLKDERIAFLDENTPDNERWLRELFESRGLTMHKGRAFSSPEALAKFYSHLSTGEITFTDNYFELGHTVEGFIKKPVLDVQNGIICAWNPNGTGAVTRFLSILK